MLRRFVPACRSGLARRFSSTSSPEVQCFYHKATGTCTYVVSVDGQATVIDPVMDFVPGSGVLKDTQCSMIMAYLQQQRLNVRYIIETHVHADHLTSAECMKRKLRGLGQNPQTLIGEGVIDVQKTWRQRLDLEYLTPDGSQFDILSSDGSEHEFGGTTVRCISTPGHTPDSCVYKIGDAVFLGDTLFMPDTGSSRCDFPNGSAIDLFNSIQDKIYSLPDQTRAFVCHDYCQGGKREAQWVTTIGEQKKQNVSCSAGCKPSDFVQRRIERDVGLELPHLIYPSVEWNLTAGKLPPKDEATGFCYLKIPLTPPYDNCFQ
eukprot:TRINITY_DN86590_c0_g1_i1.p1 TRINITY_DN86590_c0_g1~~TRINITY_DN86590_c0_g1_i1.p1  ORF type:complete len:318 (+),score=34.66 TRINITY_DN86590_c0_g1_i1:41-994(+)